MGATETKHVAAGLVLVSPRVFILQATDQARDHHEPGPYCCHRASDTDTRSFAPSTLLNATFSIPLARIRCTWVRDETALATLPISIEEDAA